MACYRAFFAFFCVVSIIYVDSLEIKICKEILSPVITLSDLQVRPLPIKLDSVASISLTADSSVDIDFGTTVEIAANYFLFSFKCPKYEPFCVDVCDAVAKNSSTCTTVDNGKCGTCPFSSGKYNIFYDLKTPNVPASGKGSIKVKILDKSRNLLGCVEAKVDFLA